MGSISKYRTILEVRDLKLSFTVRPKGQDTMRDLFVNTLRNPLKSLVNRSSFHEILNGVSFAVSKGDKIALVGENGAGKTTLCRVIAGFYAPRSGKIIGTPKVRALFETGQGLFPELTGIENIRILTKLLYGQEHPNQLNRIIHSASEFSELGDHLKLPVRNYSNGMQTRLTLSVLTEVPAELLILDEVFEGADEFFQAKMRERIKQMIQSSGAAILVSHHESILRSHCNRAILLRDGQVARDGSLDECFQEYRQSHLTI